MAPSHTTLNYMKSFRCIGGDCPQSCCTGWQVHLSRDEVKRLKPVFETDPRLANGKATIVEVAGERGALQLETNGRCSLLCESNLCQLHTHHGEDSLPDVCAMYPRHVRQLGTEVELSAKPSCPEVARLLLLAPDATKRVPFEKSLIPRYFAHEAIFKPENHPLSRHHNTLRDLALTVFDLPLPWPHRLYLVAELARRVSPVLNQQTTTDPAQALEEALRPFYRPEDLKASSDHLAMLDWTAESVFPIVCNLLTARAASSARHGTDKFRYLVARITAHDGLNLADPAAFAQKLWSLHHKRSTLLHDACGDLLDQYSARIAANYWFNESFTRYTDLNSYMRRLMMILAVHRILTVNDPEAVQALKSPAHTQRKTMDEIAVRALYNSTRALEHHPMLSQLDDALTAKSAVPLVQRICFV